MLGLRVDHLLDVGHGLLHVRGENLVDRLSLTERRDSGAQTEILAELIEGSVLDRGIEYGGHLELDVGLRGESLVQRVGLDAHLARLGDGVFAHALPEAHEALGGHAHLFALGELLQMNSEADRVLLRHAGGLDRGLHVLHETVVRPCGDNVGEQTRDLEARHAERRLNPGSGVLELLHGHLRAVGCRDGRRPSMHGRAEHTTSRDAPSHFPTEGLRRLARHSPESCVQATVKVGSEQGLLDRCPSVPSPDVAATHTLSDEDGDARRIGELGHLQREPSGEVHDLAARRRGLCDGAGHRRGLGKALEHTRGLGHVLERSLHPSTELRPQQLLVGAQEALGQLAMEHAEPSQSPPSRGGHAVRRVDHRS